MKDPALKILGERIRRKRKSIGFTQEQLAGLAAIDRSYIGSVERGERNVTFTILCKVATALKCDVGELTHGIPDLNK